MAQAVRSSYAPHAPARLSAGLPEGGCFMFPRIVVPLDGSRVAADVLGYASALAERVHAALTLVTVLAPTHTAVYGGELPGATSTDLRDAYATTRASVEAAATAYLEGVAAPLRR